MTFDRVLALRALMAEQHLDALLITNPANIQYISGFTGGADARLLITQHDKMIFTDGRYRQQVALESPVWDLHEAAGLAMEKLAQAIQGVERLGFESNTVTVQQHLDLQSHLKVPLVPIHGMVESLRMVKGDEELNLLRQAACCGDQTFEALLPLIKPGMTEKDLSDHLVFLLRQKGCAKEGFDAIVVSGENAALPHGRPGMKTLEPGEMVTLDFGGLVQGYTGDMTRTVVLSQASRRFRQVYQAVLEAQQNAVQAVRAGVACRDVDSIARKTLARYDLDQYFVHGTGHGIGLDIHEKPTLSTRSEDILCENMVVTVEPGVYIPGWGGIRIEDSLIVTRYGCEIITHTSKDLIII